MLTAAVRVFSSAGWIPLNGTSSSLLPVLTALCLLYIMMRIPWWISRPVLSSFGPSPIRRAARFAFYAAVLSRVSPLLHGAAAGKRPPSGAGGQGAQACRASRRRTSAEADLAADHAGQDLAARPAGPARSRAGQDLAAPPAGQGASPAACPQRAVPGRSASHPVPAPSRPGRGAALPGAGQ